VLRRAIEESLRAGAPITIESDENG
jgi:hypothetical protein